MKGFKGRKIYHRTKIFCTTSYSESGIFSEPKSQCGFVSPIIGHLTYNCRMTEKPTRRANIGEENEAGTDGDISSTLLNLVVKVTEVLITNPCVTK